MRDQLQVGDRARKPNITSGSWKVCVHVVRTVPAAMHRRVRADHVVVGQQVFEAQRLGTLSVGAHRARIAAELVCGKTTPSCMMPSHSCGAGTPARHPAELITARSASDNSVVTSHTPNATATARHRAALTAVHPPATQSAEAVTERARPPTKLRSRTRC